MEDKLYYRIVAVGSKGVNALKKLQSLRFLIQLLIFAIPLKNGNNNIAAWSSW